MHYLRLTLMWIASAFYLHAGVTTTLVTDELKLPVWASAPEGTSQLLWIVEKKGTIQILDRKSGKKQLFLDIVSRVGSKGNEEGLLGLAFEKDYLKSGRFYVNLTNPKGFTEIIRFTAHGKDKRQCKPESAEVLLTYKQDYRNHNGGWIGIGPDGYLYIGNGDGGSANDPKDRAQDLSSHLGKLLRIDVSPEKGYRIPKDNPFKNNSKAKAEIYAYGLRNPWRCSWDRKTKDFYIADVGQNAWEEINYVPAGKGKGANYGWRLREGMIATPKKKVGGDKPRAAIDPVYVYRHGSGPDQGVSVTGGYVYRGPIQSLQGKYFFADYANPRIWSFEIKNGKMHNFEDWTDTFKYKGKSIKSISSFGEDPEGNLLIISYKGSIYQVVEQ
ncbi:PQQ-dependent sugar dehydrogenase [Verrucomicrobiaceae bacterium N1E253]|uniref:PQQ-dependent sugar dehydrogenase n=1 Tax=Oceaniferula marina TaxID=2748318 RepID=A0A851GJ15_9BACT|nr:PQQ-dependent sugar dehydrogenase [Oceaniferula marina]NWK57169.1 PQQ-dependent sugar dehydrogenase [Oceaniferula marina]